MVVLTTPVVMFTWFPMLVTFNGYLPLLESPACVLMGLLTVWNWAMVMTEGMTWNWISATFCWSVRELRVPEGRLEKALSVGAKMVIPALELFSWLSIWLMSCVLLSRRIRVSNCPPFSRMPVMFMGPEGAGASADWAAVIAGRWKTKNKGFLWWPRKNEMKRVVSRVGVSPHPTEPASLRSMLANNIEA